MHLGTSVQKEGTQFWCKNVTIIIDFSYYVAQAHE